MAGGRVAGLLLPLVVLLTMPGGRATCGEEEYPHLGLCCVMCKAGTFVAEHCNASHTQGKCEPCETGKSFNANDNGLEGCSPCKQCREDQITLSYCTQKQDTECQCKQGYSCPTNSCEVCQRNDPMPPDRKEFMPNSTDTPNPSLSNQGNEYIVGICLGIVTGSVLLIIVVIVVKKLKCDKAASTDKDAESGLIRRPSQTIVKDLSQSELRDLCLCKGSATTTVEEAYENSSTGK